MDIALSLLALLFTVVGIIGCIVPALPGVILSYAGLLCSWFTSYTTIGTSALWIWLAITIFVSVIDYYLPGLDDPPLRRITLGHRRHGGRLRRILPFSALWHRPRPLLRRRHRRTAPRQERSR